ncbi:hypothetical protein G6F43_010912 [Rhizopus delemar]|nr:hypothetical protein G6F43_010912 [Rhizopus delemar]
MYSRVIQVLCIGLIALQSMGLAHFTMTYPSSRGFNEDQEPISPCGGFNTASSERVVFPLQNAFIEINSGHTSYSYEINAITGNSTVQVGKGSRSYPQAACLPLQLTDSIKNGTSTTLQVVYNGGDGLLYQCVDVVFSSSAPNFNTSACVNADGSSTTSNSTTTTTTSSASSMHVGGAFTFMTALFTYLLI